MTDLKKPVTRVVTRAERDHRRRLVVSLLPIADDGIIEVRERGRRTGYHITVSRLFVLLAQRTADAALEARANRPRRGSLIGGAR